ncbi:MAG: TylF/MycF family methyltransferase, partial [Gemmatimonadota bacterium]|nr:TylF/MycF family methyltransferase [Gemmatimonadota bacterium]
ERWVSTGLLQPSGIPPIMPSIAERVRAAVKDVAFRTPLVRWVSHRYQYNFSPAQLGFLCSCVDATRDVPGPIFEVGCFAGVSTVFINKHMSAEGIEKPYFAFDTFGGFTAADVAYETDNRGKDRAQLGGFSDNRQEWFDSTMAVNGVSRVRSIRADVNAFDFDTLLPPSFCLIDVDLYRPVKSVLDALYDRMPSGSMIVVDDCADGSAFDGALQAYREFVVAHAMPERIMHRKLGVIQKP